ncbi:MULTISPECIES: hypothetical protein [Microbacterium]|uniref:hypothetical protein n=1 Tax=Microbacterium TaxID=33882 RepID=UPI00277E15BA|nr:MULTISPECIES: hypothetical protein [Microbacterium]MDQ1084982.1 hypothetical protein [Microbacterium sp. SORGH_AS_0344]MDQ1169743.1 hypothetical protein [Microbacterium proteolyticum]
MTDDDLRRAMRRLDTATTPLDAPLPLDAERRLREIVGHPRDRTRRRTVTWGSAAAAVVLVLTIVTGVIWMPAPSASALTPKPLVYTAVADDASRVIADAQERLARSTSPLSPERRSLSLGWYFSGSPDDAEATVFRREWVDLRWNENLSGSIITTAAEATDADGDTVPADDPTPGTVVGDLQFVQNQFSPLVRTPPAPTAEAMRAIILASTGAPEPLAAGDVMLGVRSLQSEWTLTGTQQAALLDVVAAAPGLRVLGTTEDRLGRPVVGLGGIASGPANADVSLLISTETGRIVGYESALTEDNPNLKLPAGSITDYILWDVRDRKDAPQ